MEVPVELEPSRRLGQFEVLVDGRMVASRKGGLLAKLFKKPWPLPEAIVAAVREATRPAAG